MCIIPITSSFNYYYISCYVICNCNAANMDVVALYLSEQLNNNFILYTREIDFSVHIYIFCPPFFLTQSEEISLNAATIEKKANYLIAKFFHFDERSKSGQRILLAFGSLLLFFHRTSLQNSKNFSHFLFIKNLLKVCND